MSSCIGYAAANYQIDLILFTQPRSGDTSNDYALDAPFMPISTNAISLKNDSSKSSQPYRILSAQRSELKDQYYLLHRKPNYTLLAHYSWIQPGKNQSTVALPKISHNGWHLQGTVRVRQSNYYLFDSELQLSPPSSPQLSYTVVQKQRLKSDTVYYLDNPNLGMLVKVHKVT